MKILLTGSEGQLGQALIKTKPKNITNESIELFAFNKNDLDITNEDVINKKIKELRPNIVINAAAYTNVEKAESESNIAFQVNSLGPKLIAKALLQNGGKLLQISSDYVFDGETNNEYKTDHKRSPISIYGKTKSNGEKFIEEILNPTKQVIILRSSWIMGIYGENFAKKMLQMHKNKNSFKVISDQYGSPTSAISLAKFIWQLTEMEIKKTSIPSIIHWRNSGIASWYDVAVAIGEISLEIGLLNNSAKVIPIKTYEYKTKAKRPIFSLLDCRDTYSKLKIFPQHWRKALKEELLIKSKII